MTPKHVPVVIAIAHAILVLLGARTVAAQDMRLHAKAGASHAVTTPQASELDWGGGGSVAAELGIAKWVGVQIQTGALALSQGTPSKDPSLAPRTSGVMFGASGGVRVNALGFWIDGGGGVAITGGEARPLIDTNVGYDFRLGSQSPVLVGPFIGYDQVIADPGSLRPQDGRMVLFGIHAVLGSRPKQPPPPPPAIVEPKRAPDPDPPKRTDRDGDTVFDDEDVCPDVAGIRTDDPSTNGCPPTTIRMVEDHLELPDRIHFELDSPRVMRRSYPLLHQIADYIRARGDISHVQIQGHADEVGTPAYNLALSGHRAEEVKKVLVEFGVQAEIATEGFGASKPRDLSHSDRARQVNRRVEFIVTVQRQMKETPDAK